MPEGSSSALILRRPLENHLSMIDGALESGLFQGFPAREKSFGCDQDQFHSGLLR